jgi:ribosome-binding factor A
MGSEKEQKLTLRGLQHAAGFVQAKLARRLQTRFTPEVQFVLDQGVKHSIEMTRLINEALGSSATATPQAREDDVAAGDDAVNNDSPDQVGSADGAAEEAPKDS